MKILNIRLFDLNAKMFLKKNLIDYLSTENTVKNNILFIFTTDLKKNWLNFISDKIMRKTMLSLHIKSIPAIIVKQHSNNKQESLQDALQKQFNTI